MELLPHTFQFRFAVPVEYAADRPRRGRWPLGDELSPLPLFSTLDGLSENVSFSAGWNEKGFGVAATVRGKRMPLVAKLSEAESGDGLQIWIDTRNTQGSHRASRYCHRFAILPAVGSSKSRKPAVRALPIQQARESRAVADLSSVLIGVELTTDGYRIEAWFPSDTLYGYDPDVSARIGFHAAIKDSELGDRSLTMGDEFPVDHDPSLWTTLELVRE